MTQDDYRYPQDEFDELGRDRAPQAVHRAPRPWWRVWGPLIAVVILAPILAFALVNVATQDDTDNEAGGATATATAEEGTEATEGTGEEATDDGAAAGEGEATTEEPAPEETTEVTQEPTEEPPAPLDQAVAVSVLNGASVQGLAGRTTDRLVAAGWTSVTAGNYQSAQPEVSTVYYRDADLADEAAAIGTELGIATVTELADVESITVVLRSDFAE